MSNVIAGVVRGQYAYLEEHIAAKKRIYQRYAEGLKGLPVQMNPIAEGTEPNYWLSGMILDPAAMCKQVRSETEALYHPEYGKSARRRSSKPWLRSMQRNAQHGNPCICSRYTG